METYVIIEKFQVSLVASHRMNQIRELCQTVNAQAVESHMVVSMEYVKNTAKKRKTAGTIRSEERNARCQETNPENSRLLNIYDQDKMERQIQLTLGQATIPIADRIENEEANIIHWRITRRPVLLSGSRIFGIIIWWNVDARVANVLAVQKIEGDWSLEGASGKATKEKKKGESLYFQERWDDCTNVMLSSPVT